MITFNTPYRKNDEPYYASAQVWLGALYSEKIAHKNSNHSIESLNSIQKLLNYSFINLDTFTTALTHKSFFHENKLIVKSDNEKLEFLGDSVLSIIITKYIFLTYPSLSEGELSKLRGTIVNEESLAKLAKAINLEANIFIGKGEFKTNASQDIIMKDSILADAFEAILGAVYLESDLETVEKLLFKAIHLYEASTNDSFIKINNYEDFDPKSKLQELVMEKLSTAPVYKSTENTSGFEVELWVSEKCLAKMTGISKKKLEKDLARIVLENNLI